ncbi:MAG: sodium:proton antiporter [Spirochaetaceae bacterium]
MIIERIADQINYIGAAALFCIGLYMVLVHTNLIRKIIGINIMETSVFLVFVTTGFVRSGRAPIVREGVAESIYVNPLPSALILTGIVVAVSITVYALSLIVRLYEAYGSVELDVILEKRRLEHHD